MRRCRGGNRSPATYSGQLIYATATWMFFGASRFFQVCSYAVGHAARERGLVERPLPPRSCTTTEPSRMYTNTMRVMPVDRALRLLMTIFSCGIVEVIAHLPGLQTLRFALELKQGVRIMSRSATRPDPRIAAEKSANNKACSGSAASRWYGAPENSQ